MSSEQKIAVDVERLAKAVCDAIWGGVVLCSDEAMVVDVLRRELPQPKAAESEWPADAPDWAMMLVENADERRWYVGGFAGEIYWRPRCEEYTGTRPASWAGKPWQECVLRRPATDEGPGGGA